MSYVLPILFALGVYVALPAVLVAGWVRWARRRQIGRTWPSLTGFSLGTASALLAIGSMVYAGMIGGFRYYDLTLLRIFRWVFSSPSPVWSSQRWGFDSLGRFVGMLLRLLSEPYCSGLERRLASRSKNALRTASGVG
jgi:hypothetical protein